MGASNFDTPFHIHYLKIYFTAPPIQEKNPTESPKKLNHCICHALYINPTPKSKIHLWRNMKSEDKSPDNG